jgi:hypothetical protein
MKNIKMIVQNHSGSKPEFYFRCDDNKAKSRFIPTEDY